MEAVLIYRLMGTLLQRLGESTAVRVHTIWTLVSLFMLFGGMTIGYVLKPAEYVMQEDDGTFPLALCTRVIDGDTIVIEWMGNEERVRVLGIDAPETRRTRGLRAQAEELAMDPEFLLRYGDIATKTVENWLLNRKVRLVFPDDEVRRDNFGRLLCYVELQGVDIGERLLLLGNAIVYDAPHPRAEAYKLFQTEAQNQRRGIWRNL